MTESVLTVDVNDPAGEILRLFAGYPVHHLPVVDGPRVVGMLSSADVMKLELFLPRGSGTPIEYLNQRMKVGALLRRAPVTILPHQPVEAAARLMAENGVHALAVVDAHERLLGIITTTDIMQAALGARQAAALESRAATDDGPGAGAGPADAGLERLHDRIRELEEIRRLAGRYLQAGQDQQLHAALRRALDRLGPE